MSLVGGGSYRVSEPQHTHAKGKTKSDIRLVTQSFVSFLSDASVSALMDTVNCVIDVSLALEFPGENVEVVGIELGFA